MASENKTVIEIVNDMRQRAAVARRQDADATIHHHAVGDMLAYLANQVESAHKREILVERHLADEYLAAKDDERLTVVANYENVIAAKDRIIAAKDAEIAELRECLKQACEVACGDCRLAVWNNQKFVKCKKHKNWKCPFGTERWRKALEGAKDA